MMPAPEGPLAAALGWSDFEPEALACLELAALARRVAHPARSAPTTSPWRSCGRTTARWIACWSSFSVGCAPRRWRRRSRTPSVSTWQNGAAKAPSRRESRFLSPRLCDKACRHHLEEALGRARARRGPTGLPGLLSAPAFWQHRGRA